MAKRDKSDKRNFVVLGAGAAGLTCCETLRQAGYTGKIFLINAEDVLPYDRTLLSKKLPIGLYENFILRDKEFLKEADIKVINDSVWSVDTDKKKIELINGRPLKYDKLLLASGSIVKRPNI